MKRRDFFRHGIAAAPLLVSGFNLMGTNNLYKETRFGSSDNGFLPLFDGKTLNGWHTTPRVYVPSREPEFAEIPAEELKAAVIQYYEQMSDPEERAKAREHGVWEVQDGAITGGQTPNSKRGAYLLTNEKYGDFELILDARPDWPVDTGIMVRAHELGSVGFQVLLDHRPGGSIGGVYGNSTGNFRAYPFVLDGDEQEGFKVTNLRGTVPDKQSFKPDYAASVDEFLSVWKANDWNTFSIKCTGRLPLIEIWINGTLISKLDTEKLANRVPGYNSEAIFKRIGREGYIGFEVHDNDSMGYNRWAPGAVCRWKNISLKKL
jgi:hypothetical protein